MKISIEIKYNDVIILCEFNWSITYLAVHNVTDWVKVEVYDGHIPHTLCTGNVISYMRNILICMVAACST